MARGPHDLVYDGGQEYHGLLQGDAMIGAPVSTEGISVVAVYRDSIQVSPVACSEHFGLDLIGRAEKSWVGWEICSANLGLLKTSRTSKDDVKVQIDALGHHPKTTPGKLSQTAAIVPWAAWPSPVTARLLSAHVLFSSTSRSAPCRGPRRGIRTTQSASAVTSPMRLQNQALGGQRNARKESVSLLAGVWLRSYAPRNVCWGRCSLLLQSCRF